MKMLPIALVALVGICGAVFGQAKPASKPVAAEGDSSMGEMRVQTLKGMTYLRIDNQATLMTLAQVIPTTAGKLMETVKAKHVAIAGPMMLVYHGVDGNPAKKFKLEVGIMVNDDAAEPGAGIIKTKAEPFKCATMLYSGPVAKLGLAHQQLYADLFGAGLTPTGVSREYYLYFEDPNSANNVILIQVGVQ